MLFKLLKTLEVHKERSNKMQQYIRCYCAVFVWSSTCFGRHTAHHQKPKTELAASAFCTCSWWTLSGYAWQHRPTTRTKSRGCQFSFRFLMMGGVSPETCWASYKYWIITFDIMLHLVGSFFMNCTTMHRSMNVKTWKCL